MPLLLAALLCGLAGGVAASLRAERWVGRVHLAIGFVPPVGRLQDPGEIAHRLCSMTQVYALSGLEHCVIQGEDVEPPPDCPRDPVLHSDPIEDTNLVTFSVETNHADLSSKIVESVTKRILAEHEKLFSEVTRSNQRNIEEFEQLLARLEVNLAHDRTSRSPPASADEPGGVWSEVVAVRQHLERLRGNSLAAQARPTRVVAGPEVERVPRMPRPLVAALLGALAGATIVGLILAMRQAIRQRA